MLSPAMFRVGTRCSACTAVHDSVPLLGMACVLLGAHMAGVFQALLALMCMALCWRLCSAS